ncbi:nucleotidyl transferase AbiEii/AbiGii toxin family protein [Chitinophaga agrisoli]|uniref:Nucleotidyl transferase AbiEii/AbiGii toxin family protein n=1 Tax=Chitinophaga agrisoli TaxID=2607653 RepID=A0A5B2W1V3_9BACT|nr:nucleotidyl transferase AbiEii/AbiGii toxin family protein [Chitinophaga agrisoli]KAA2244447.1 nucleotidyl transferase AbiEii/AbiGii toxin family protein [Chitinophaga agrisoli]
MAVYLHQRKDFFDLIRTLAAEMGIQETLIEKDYWIMHVLHSLKAQGFVFELKGGTSLSKGFKLIDRFSEDIDLHISPPKKFTEETGIVINENPKNDKQATFDNRKIFFDWLAANIHIDGIVEVLRDTDFDDIQKYRSGGIRLKYESPFESIGDLKDGVLLEAGFAQVTPNSPIDISSWMYDKATSVKLNIADSRAMRIACYHPGYTFVEKLQTVVTKYRNETQGDRKGPIVNFMRQYYDIFKLLQTDLIQAFIKTDEYQHHKDVWFSKADKEIPLFENPALLLPDEKLMKDFRKRYQGTAKLYYNGQPDFDEMVKYIRTFVDKL